jgi:hypothetical protein
LEVLVHSFATHSFAKSLRASSGGRQGYCALESNVRVENPPVAEWEGCPLPISTELMRAPGVRSKAIFSADAGMFVVHHDAVETLLELAMEFREFAAKCGYSLPLAPLLA